MSGLEIAILYGLEPLKRGLCCTVENAEKVLLNFLRGNSGNEDNVRKILSQFPDAFAYLQLIAKSNQIDDPFDGRVVEAYWLGNDLLEKVSLDDLKKMLQEKLRKENGLSAREANRLTKQIPEGVAPHHSFKVFWSNGPDDCLVNWGRVEKIGKNLLSVCYPKPSCIRGDLVEFAERDVVWDENLVPEVKPGCIISFHLGRACQVLKIEEQDKLSNFTRRNWNLMRRI